MNFRPWLACSTLILFAACSSEQAPPVTHVEPHVTVAHAHATATPPGSTVAAVYLQLQATTDDQLRSVSAAVAERTEIHNTLEVDGTMQMRPVEAVPLPAGALVEFAPGGLHVMLIGLQQPLVAGESFPLTLQFEHAEEAVVDVAIVAPGDGHTDAHSHH